MRGWCLHSCYGRCLGWININSTIVDQEAQKLSSRHPKSTFKGIHLEFVELASVKHFPQDSKMIFPFLGLHHNVIHIIFNLFVYHIMEYGCHSSLVGGTGIF
jgi:hypothetical protein